MKNSIILLLCCLWINLKAQDKSNAPKTISEVKIIWIDSLTGDFSFKNEWKYSENIFKNDKGQLICDGNCPSRIENMREKSNEIPQDSLDIYYQLIDTTHYFKSLQVEAWCYEFFESSYMNCFKNESGFINCSSANTISTHCSLRLAISGDICRPLVQLNSTKQSIGTKIFKCTKGYIKIDSNYYSKGILKAEFNFSFYNSIDPLKPINWKGKIYSVITEL